MFSYYNTLEVNLAQSSYGKVKPTQLTLMPTCSIVSRPIIDTGVLISEVAMLRLVLRVGTIAHKYFMYP